MKKVFIVGGCFLTNQLFIQNGWSSVTNIHEADLVVFTGGADVSPSLYNAPVHPTTHFDTNRDEREIQIFALCQELKKATVGICRGGQFLNVMGGGEMYQNVSRHGNAHNIVDLETGEVVYVSSTHHQMMKPADTAIIIAVGNEGGYREWYEGEVRKMETSNTDIEVVYYPHTNSLCFQPHPEYNSDLYGGMKKYFFSLIEKYLK